MAISKGAMKRFLSRGENGPAARASAGSMVKKAQKPVPGLTKENKGR